MLNHRIASERDARSLPPHLIDRTKTPRATIWRGRPASPIVPCDGKCKPAALLALVADSSQGRAQRPAGPDLRIAGSTLGQSAEGSHETVRHRLGCAVGSRMRHHRPRPLRAGPGPDATRPRRARGRLLGRAQHHRPAQPRRPRHPAGPARRLRRRRPEPRQGAEDVPRRSGRDRADHARPHRAPYRRPDARATSAGGTGTTGGRRHHRRARGGRQRGGCRERRPLAVEHDRLHAARHDPGDDDRLQPGARCCGLGKCVNAERRHDRRLHRAGPGEPRPPRARIHQGPYDPAGRMVWRSARHGAARARWLAHRQELRDPHAVGPDLHRFRVVQEPNQRG